MVVPCYFCRRYYNRCPFVTAMWHILMFVYSEFVSSLWDGLFCLTTFRSSDFSMSLLPRPSSFKLGSLLNCVRPRFRLGVVFDSMIYQVFSLSMHVRPPLVPLERVRRWAIQNLLNMIFQFALCSLLLALSGQTYWKMLCYFVRLPLVPP